MWTVSQENQKLRLEFKADMSASKQDIYTEARNYANNTNLELRGALTNLEALLGHSIHVVKNLVYLTLPRLDSIYPPK